MQLVRVPKDAYNIYLKTWQPYFYQDEHSDLTGYMYVLKKLEVKSFEPKGVPKVSVLPSLVNATMQEIEEYVSVECELWEDKVNKRGVISMCLKY